MDAVGAGFRLVGWSPLAALAWLLAAPPPLAAQESVPLDRLARGNATIRFQQSQATSEVGLSFSGDLNGSQQLREVFKLELRRGEAVVLDLQSKMFDPKLQVLAPHGKELASDDDGGDDGRSSRLVFAAPDDKSLTFYVVVGSADSRKGKFALTATPRKAPTAAPASELRADLAVQGRFDDGSALRVGDQKVYASYWFDAAAGDRVQIEGRSPTLELDMSLSQGERLLRDGSRSLRGTSLYYPVTAGGRYQVNVVTRSGSAGAYTVQLRKLPTARPAADPLPLAVGQPAAGTFTDDTPRLLPTSNRPYADFKLDGAAGDKFLVSATLGNTNGAAGYSATAVTLSAGVDTPAGFAEVRQATSPPGVNAAQMTVTFVRGGSLLIRLAGRSGAVTPYSVIARPAAQPPSKDPAAPTSD